MSDNELTIKKEFVFATHCPSKLNKDKDCLVVKEILHHPDGRTKRNLRIIENYQRPFWITKKEYRDHNDKKEYEVMPKLDKYYTNQTTMAKKIFKLLNGFDTNQYVGIKDVNSSPYVYGTDITTPTLLYKEYTAKYPNLASANTLAVIDFEWDFLSTP